MSGDWFDLRSLVPPTLRVLDDERDDPAPEVEDGEELEDLDLHTRLFKRLVVKALVKWKQRVPTSANIAAPRNAGPLECEAVGFGGIELPVVDEDWDQSLKRLLAYRTLRSIVVPMSDLTETWDSAEDAVEAFETFLPLGTLLARPNCTWDEMSSDDAQSRVAFAGLGALRLSPVRDPANDPDGAVWVSDFGWLATLEVREGFERYGAMAYFDASQRIVRIHWSHVNRDVRPGDADWNHAKWAWRVSLVLGTTVADHLVGVHLIISNSITRAARSELGVDHPVRRLLKPFTWRSIYVNYSATYSLCPERGFLHRGGALTYPALREALEASARSLRYTTVPRLIAAKKAEHLGQDFPWAVDALALYEVIHRFVGEYLDLYIAGDAVVRDPEIQGFWAALSGAAPNLGLPPLERDNLIDVLAMAIWCVTGLHEAVGSVIEYAMNPTFAGTKIRPGTELADVQASVQALLLVALTGLGMPRLLDDFSHLCLDEKGAAAFRRFQGELATLADRIDEANKTRRWPCNLFNPRFLESSVSI